MVKRQRTLSLVSIILVSVWAIFTVTLVAWWIYFGTVQVDRLIDLQKDETHQLVKFQRMLLWEGIAMIVSLVGGAMGLFYYIFREAREAKKLRAFFAAFTHEIKTPLASTRLKSEMLIERLHDTAHKELVQKLLTDVGRLYLQLENSLFLADNSSRDVFFEPLSVRDMIAHLQDLWPQLSIQVDGDVRVSADRRMLEAVLANIFQNAINHGQAKKVCVALREEKGKACIVVQDDGVGFQGDTKALGYLFSRHYAGSGSGIGLFLVHSLIEKLRGIVSYPKTDKGFCVSMTLPVAA